jgi:signal transduction histidine kinase/CheY-like chemotaxis protein
MSAAPAGKLNHANLSQGSDIMLQTPSDPALSEYFTVSEAAQFLGVSPWTLRNWDRAGKVPTLRHPKNGYRIYRREDLDAILQIDGSASAAAPGDWNDVGPAGHFVQFYENDAYLIGSVGAFIGGGLDAGGGAVVIATRAHRAALQRKLRARGFDLAGARARGQFVALDAEETLAQFMVGGVPDPRRFAEVIGATVARAARGRPRVRAFGEMVALLWAQGNRDAAIRVEELWNDIAKAHTFALLCAYPLSGFDRGDTAGPFDAVCRCHTRVVPAESYAQIPAADERRRAIAKLQQKARSLEAEIAHRKEVEATLMRLREQQAADLLEKSRLVAELREADRRKDEFLATLAHELRNPLAPISNAVQILRLNCPPELAEVRDVLDRQVSLMARLVDDLLDVSRITRGKVELRRERVELAAVVGNAAESCRPLIESCSHVLTVDLPPDPVYLDADPLRLSQVLANLLNNAAKYTEPGGHIAVTAAREGDQVAVRVRDTGVGIPAVMLPRVWDMFTQVDHSLERRQGGLGIGLTLVRTLVQLHGGTVEAYSAGPGHGSEFVVRLPVADPEPQPAVDESAEPPPCRVLLVDDNEDLANSMARLLRLVGHDVHLAHDGLAAVDAAIAVRPDVVLMDIGLPKLNGFEAGRRIREQLGAGVVMIALTGWGQDEDRDRSHAAGFDHHVTKPVKYETLEKLFPRRSAGR